jgi:hypothetical protein
MSCSWTPDECHREHGAPCREHGPKPCKHPADDHTSEGCRAHVREPALPGGWDFCPCDSKCGFRCGQGTSAS